MHSSRAVVLHGFPTRGATEASAFHRFERTVSRRSRAAWMRFAVLTRHSAGADGSGEAVLTPPRREQPLPFC